MKKVTFTKQINATANKVYETMLGLHNKSTYEYWTSVFNPTCTYEGSWDKGSEIHFIGIDENGKKGGIASEILEHQIAKYISIKHFGFIDGDTIITEGEQVEKWSGGQENYTFQEKNGITSLIVEIDTIDEYEDYFNNTYPNALEKLKEISEK